MLPADPAPPALTGYKPYWARRFGIAPFLPMSRAEMAQLGWDECDIILVTGDAYIDHPSFGMALIGRLLEAQGFRVGIISQPDWQSADPFKILGKPAICFGITAGNMDSMVNRYTADRKIRSDDAYTPHAQPGKRPDRSVIVYSQRAREAYPGVPIIIGSIEASLRRIAHYDYWSDTVRPSILPHSKADLLIFGNAERALLEVVHRLAKGEPVSAIRDVRGTAFMVPRGWKPGADWAELDSSAVDTPGPLVQHADPYAMEGVTPAPSGVPVAGDKVATIPVRIVSRAERLAAKKSERAHTAIRLPSFEQVMADPVLYAHASRTFHLESNPGNARALIQGYGSGASARDLWLNPPPIPLSTAEMDYVFGMPYARAPHPGYGEAKIPAWEMIRFSVNIMRGCFGGCTFCSITEHEGRIMQSRSEDSIIREIEEIRDKTPGFTGVISDIGGPTANMYRMACKDPKIESSCRRLSCVYPGICENLNTDHAPLIKLYRKARALPGIKKILIGSGLRYDLAVKSPDYIKELVTHHVGGYLKIAPEHTEEGALSKMMKPGIGSYDRFKQMFDKFSKEAGKEQYLIPYFIAAHPGTTDEDMMNLALWLKRNNFRLDQVQTFLPTPLALATAMWHTGKNPLRKVSDSSENVAIVRHGRQRRLHKAFLRYHDPENWPLLREALLSMGRADLIGPGKRHLIPPYQPAGTGGKGVRSHANANSPKSALVERLGGPRRAPGKASPAASGQDSVKATAKAVARGASPKHSPSGSRPGSQAAGNPAGKSRPAPGGRHPAVPRHPLSQRKGR